MRQFLSIDASFQGQRRNEMILDPVRFCSCGYDKLLLFKLCYCRNNLESEQELRLLWYKMRLTVGCIFGGVFSILFLSVFLGKNCQTVTAFVLSRMAIETAVQTRTLSPSSCQTVFCAYKVV